MTKKILVDGFLIYMFPQVAWADDIPGIILLLAAIPLLNIVLVVVFALIKLNVKIFITHAFLVMSWIFLFWVMASYTDSDFLAWLPIYLSIAHSLWLVYRLIRHSSSPGRQA